MNRSEHPVRDAHSVEDFRVEAGRDALVEVRRVFPAHHFVFGSGGALIGQHVDAHQRFGVLHQLCGGFDHNFCVDGEGMREIAIAYEPETGREMTVYSDMPGVQLYTFNGTSGLKNKDGSDMIPHGALCLETQFYPDSVHHENFPFRYVTPEKPFESKTIYKFTVK